MNWHKEQRRRLSESTGDLKPPKHRLRAGEGEEGGSNLTGVHKIDLNAGILGYTYVGTISMGDAQEDMQVTFDTGSDWLTIEGIQCMDGCEGNRFDPIPSGKPVSGGFYGQPLERNYGLVKMTGSVYADTVCIGKTLCASNFEYFLI